MQRPTWERVEALLKAGLDIEDTTARDAFLVRECGSDTELLAEMRRLFADSDDDASRFLEPPSMLAFDLTGRTIGDFEIIEELGRGSSGVVYRATQRSLNRVVALKVLPLVLRANDVTSERFRREALAASKLGHPGIANVISFGEVDGTFYYAMEFVDGPSLRDVMDRAWKDKALPIDSNVSDHRAIARLVAEVADALHFAHENRVVHRDVKPHNILIERDGRPRLIDFGLAKLLDQRSISMRGDLIGTMYYMSPEQTRARQEDVDRRSDVFSLGVVMYELLAHRRPFDGSSHVEIFKSITEDEAPSMRRAPVRVPGDLEKICRHALEKDRNDRYQTAREFAVDLRRFLNGEPPLAKPLPIAAKLARAAVKRRTLLLAVPVALVVGAGAMLAAQPSGPTFDVQVETLSGTQARLVSRRMMTPFDRDSAKTVDHGRGRAWTIALPLGMHRLELIAADGSFAQWTVIPSSGVVDNSFRVRLLEPARAGAAPAEWSFVPGADVERLGRAFGAAAPAPGSPTSGSHDAFLVAQAHVSNADFRLVQREGWTPEFPISWNNLAKAFRELPAEAIDPLPLVGLNYFEAQRIAVQLGGRLPDAAEVYTLTTGGTRWWEEEPAAVIVVDRPLPEGRMGVQHYLDGAVGVRAVAASGPFALFHAIGNVSCWTATVPIDEHGQVDRHGTAFGLAWSQGTDALASPASDWFGSQLIDFGHLEVGLRRVRPLAPLLGATY